MYSFLECLKDEDTQLHLEIIFFLQAAEESLPEGTTEHISLGIRRYFAALGAQDFKAMSLCKRCNTKRVSKREKFKCNFK